MNEVKEARKTSEIKRRTQINKSGQKYTHSSRARPKNVVEDDRYILPLEFSE
jgi:hypothetical protein